MKNFPKVLARQDTFVSPIWIGDAPQYLKQINKISDPYIKASKKNFKKEIDTRNKTFGDKKDHGFVFHSTSLIQEKNLLKPEEGTILYTLIGMVIYLVFIF